ncbi:MAG: response regulator transcription factor [Myxococcales bacterium]|nr:response regulator transcription factor [Myxococcales bacterium]
MGDSLVIVGDPERAAELERRARSLGYDVSRDDPGESGASRAVAHAPAVILAALGAGDARALMIALRERYGADVPVVLYGRIGSARPELADILELGADRFLHVPLEPAELESALLELVGPAGRARGGGAPARQLDGVDDELLDLEGVREPTRPIRDALVEADVADEIAAAVMEDVAEVLGEAAPDVVMTARLADERVDEVELPEALDGLDELDELDELVAREPTPIQSFVSLGGPARADFVPTQRADAGRRVDAAELDARALEADARSSGSLELLSAAELLVELGEERFTGRLELVLTPDRWRTLWWRDGAVTRARSSDPHDGLLDTLARAGLLGAADVLVGARLIDDARPELGVELLAQASLLKRSERGRALELHAIRCLAPTLSWGDDGGRWTLVPEALGKRGDVGLRARPDVVLLGALQTSWPTEQLRERVGDGAQRPALREPVALEELRARFGLSAGERAWLERLDGLTTLDELVERVTRREHEEHRLLALVYALTLAGHLELRGDAREPAARGGVAIDRARVEERLRLLQTEDYFTALGLERGASRLEVLLAHAELLETFSDERLEPETVARYAARGDASELLALRAALDTARDVLLDDVMRAVYRAHLPPSPDEAARAREGEDE